MWDKSTSAGLCTKNDGGGLCAREGVFAGHYGISSVRQDTLSRYKELDSCPLVVYQFNHH